MSAGNGAGPRTPRIAIVGAGFGGLGLAIRLKQAGIDSFTIFDRAEGVGGVWRDNTYPGLTCDVPSHLYSFSFEPKHDWSRRFPRRDEILAYLEHCTDKYGLREHLRLATAITGADFDERTATWRVRDGEGGVTEAEFLVAATGQLSRPAYPSIPGLDSFEGRMFHSGRWDPEYDLTGKRVAVVGTGASAIQLVPEIAPLVSRLHVFQRSAPWVMPKPDRPYRPRQRELFRRFPWVQALSRAYIYLRFESLILAFTKARWLAKPYELGYRRRLRRIVPDPELWPKLTPDYPLGCKRVVISNDYLPTLARANVDVVTTPIREVRSDRLITDDDVEHPVDAIILATGFQANDFLAPMEIRGRAGRDLNEAWREGAEAYLGMAVAGFPNMFVLYGPNTNLGAGSIVFMLESQINYVLEAIRATSRSGSRWIDVRPDVQDEFNLEIQQRLDDTVWTAGCKSWYRTESGKVVNNWPGFTLEYRLRTRRPNLADYELARPGAP